MAAPQGGTTRRGRRRSRGRDGHGIDAVDRFPDDNPNAVMRYDSGGRLVYANRSSQPILASLGTEVGESLPRELLGRLAAVIPRRGSVELVAASRTYALWPVAIPELEATNLYSTDVTAERAVVKFPDQNPNPVLRFDARGTLIYANPASARLRRGLGLRVGRRMPRALHEELLARSRAEPWLSARGGGQRRVLHAAARRRPGVRLRERLRHRCHRCSRAGAPRGRERAPAPQHPPRAHRSPTAGG